MFRHFNKIASIIALWGILSIGQFAFADDSWIFTDDQGVPVDYQTLADSFFDELAKFQAIDPVATKELLFTTVNSASMAAAGRNLSRLSSATFERVHAVNDPDIRRGPRVVQSTLGQAPAHYKSDLMPWFTQFGDFLHQKTTNYAPEYKSDSYTFILGLDKRLSRETLVGVGIGGSFASVTSNNTQKGKANSFTAIGYGSYNFDDWIIAGNFGYASSNYQFSRNILGIVADAQLGGDSFFGGVDVSKKFRYGGLFDVLPFASLNFVTMDVDDYRDHIGAIRLESKGGDSILQNMGVRFTKTVRGDLGAIWTPGAYAAWVHDYEDSNLYSTTSYFGSSPITTVGALKPRDRGAFGLNVNAVLGHVTLYGALDLELASKYDAETIQGGFSFEF